MGSTGGLAARVGVAASWLILAGCSGGGGSFLTGGTTVGQLKTSLSRVEYENSELEKQVAQLQRENRAMEDRLVQEQLESGELTARLDDARNLLRDRGVDLDTRVSSRKGEQAAEGDGGDADFRTVPAGQSSRRRRKAPFVRIPGPRDSGTSENGSGGAGDLGATERTSARLNDLERHSYHGNPNRWTRTADATDDLTTIIR